MRTVFLFLIQIVLLQAVDFDVVVIGTSPIPMCEAIYQAFSGKTVLLLDRWPESGGAWKSITACGIPHADMGCHQLVGANIAVKEFLEKRVGCTMVAMEKPLEPCSEKQRCPDFYFSKGCYELIHNLERIISKTNIVYLLNHKVDMVVVERGQVIVQTNGMSFTAQKVITIPGSYFQVEGVAATLQKPSASKYWHLYLLVQDGEGPKFSYQNYSFSGISRCMNLTHFVGLTDTGKQLFVFQAYNEAILTQGQAILEDMKRKSLIGASAYIVNTDSYIYEQYPYNTSWYYQLAPEARIYFEILDTSAFGSFSRYLSKWEQSIPLFKELFRE